MPDPITATSHSTSPGSEPAAGMTSTSIQGDLLVIRRSQTSENAGVTGQVPKYSTSHRHSHADNAEGHRRRREPAKPVDWSCHHDIAHHGSATHQEHHDDHAPRIQLNVENGVPV